MQRITLRLRVRTLPLGGKEALEQPRAGFGVGSGTLALRARAVILTSYGFKDLHGSHVAPNIIVQKEFKLLGIMRL